ncbi:MAG: RuvX/YqgF family protein [Candidatus Moraniibacteriota bacterium]
MGESKIGVALAHAETRIAVPYAVWRQDEPVWEYLREVVDIENIGQVILGLPAYAEAGHEQEIRAFAESLRRELAVEVIFANEMFTTKMARANLTESKKRDLAAYDDAEAASILLRDWLAIQKGLVPLVWENRQKC